MNNTKITDFSVIANTFNDYFVNIAENLISQIQPHLGTYESYLKNPVQNSFYFKAITEIEVTNEVARLVKLHKSSLELSNPSIIFHVIDLIVKPFTFLLNWSVEVGIFPDCLKISKVVPIHKKGNKDDVSNYRPISLLSVFEKYLKDWFIIVSQNFGINIVYSIIINMGSERIILRQ